MSVRPYVCLLARPRSHLIIYKRLGVKKQDAKIVKDQKQREGQPSEEIGWS